MSADVNDDCLPKKKVNKQNFIRIWKHLIWNVWRTSKFNNQTKSYAQGILWLGILKSIRDGNFSSLVWRSSLVLNPLLELVPVPLVHQFREGI